MMRIELLMREHHKYNAGTWAYHCERFSRVAISPERKEIAATDSQIKK